MVTFFNGIAHAEHFLLPLKRQTTKGCTSK